MISVSLFSPSEIAISDYTEEQLPKWNLSVVDYREFREIGRTGIEIFDLGNSEIKPVSLIAKIHRNGTTVTEIFKAQMSNGDILESRRTEIYPSLERDQNQAMHPYGFIKINEDLIDTKIFGFYPETPDFDSLRNFYTNYWIPSKNKEIPETFTN